MEGLISGGGGGGGEGVLISGIKTFRNNQWQCGSKYAFNFKRPVE